MNVPKSKLCPYSAITISWHLSGCCRPDFARCSHRHRCWSGCRSGRAAYQEADDIYEKRSQGHDDEELRRWQDNAEEGVKRKAARSDKTEGYGCREQLKWILEAALAVPDTILQVPFNDRYEHCAEDTSSAERGQEAEGEGEATANLTEDS